MTWRGLICVECVGQQLNPPWMVGVFCKRFKDRPPCRKKVKIQPE